MKDLLVVIAFVAMILGPALSASNVVSEKNKF
jgi:hypothetical protein